MDEDGTAVASDELGRGTELVYENCYEHVAAFRVPITTLSALVGQPLPTGYAYRTFDPARTIGQLVASAVECDQGGHTVTDVWVHVVVLPPPGSVLRQLRVRHYTSSPQTRARFGLFCFGDVTGTGEVVMSNTILPTGNRTGYAYGSDGVGSVELTTSVTPATTVIPPVTIQQFTVQESAVHGVVEYVVDGGNQLAGPPATLKIDGTTITGGLGSLHVFPAAGASFTWSFHGLTSCAPGLDWQG